MKRAWVLVLAAMLIGSAPYRTDIPILIPAAVGEISVSWAICFTENNVYIQRASGGHWLVDEGGMAGCLQKNEATPPDTPVGFVMWR